MRKRKGGVRRESLRPPGLRPPGLHFLHFLFVLNKEKERRSEGRSEGGDPEAFWALFPSLSLYN